MLPNMESINCPFAQLSFCRVVFEAFPFHMGWLDDSGVHVYFLDAGNDWPKGNPFVNMVEARFRKY